MKIQNTKHLGTFYDTVSTAYHEAAHAIYTLLCSIKVPLVYIMEKDNKIDGFCHYEIPDITKIQDNKLLYFIIDIEVGIKYAGLTAEKYHFKTMSGSDTFPMFLRDGSSDDTLSASYIIKKYNVAQPGKKRYDYKKKIIRKVFNSLKEYWDDVILISHALFCKKKLTFDDIKNILKKSKNKIFWKEQFKLINLISDNQDIFDESELKSLLGIDN